MPIRISCPRRIFLGQYFLHWTSFPKKHLRSSKKRPQTSNIQCLPPESGEQIVTDSCLLQFLGNFRILSSKNTMKLENSKRCFELFIVTISAHYLQIGIICGHFLYIVLY